MELKTFNSSLGQVSYRLIGDGPRKILFFHGFPGSSAQIHLFISSLDQHKSQVICFDRPGYNMTLREPVDMLQDTLQIGNEIIQCYNWVKFEVVAVSGGTPYAISFAQAYPNFVSGVRIICGLGYLRIPEIKKYFRGTKIFSLRFLRFIPGAFIKYIMVPKSGKNSNQRSRLFEFFYPTSPSDRKIIEERNLGGTLSSVLKEAVVQNARGPIADTKVFLSFWGADLKNFKVPIHFWHGDEDRVISYKVSEIMTKLIPRASFTLVPEEGHLSLPVKRTSDILSLLL